MHVNMYVEGAAGAGAGAAERRTDSVTASESTAALAEPSRGPSEALGRTRGDATHPPAATVLRGDRAITKGPDTETVP